MTTVLINKKICLLGVFGVGKTSLINRFVYDRFDDSYWSTIGVKISQKILPPFQQHRSGQMIQHTFLIWDIAGLDKFDRVALNYFRGAAGALAVADLTRPETIDDLNAYCQKFLSVNPGATLVVLGNKLDIFQRDTNTLQELQKAAVDFSTESIPASFNVSIFLPRPLTSSNFRDISTQLYLFLKAEL